MSRKREMIGYVVMNGSDAMRLAWRGQPLLYYGSTATVFPDRATAKMAIQDSMAYYGTLARAVDTLTDIAEYRIKPLERQ